MRLFGREVEKRKSLEYGKGKNPQVFMVINFAADLISSVPGVVRVEMETSAEEKDNIHFK